MEAILLPDQIVCGYFDCSVFSGLSTSPERTRTLFEIEYYLEDGLTTFSDGHAYPIRGGHVLIGRPGQVCNSLLPFKTKYLKCNATGALATCLSALPPYFPVHRTYEVEQLLDRVIAAHTDGNALKLGAALLSLLLLLTEEARAQALTIDPIHRALRDAKRFIEAHYAEPIKLSDVAAAVSLSPSYLHARFSDQYAITPHEYLLQCRIKAAKDLLCMSDRSILEIAEACGFANQQYLGTVFKQAVGLSPGKFRREHRRDYLI
ncbi:MAG: helix-turn-helix transcriptional regulator [Clostridia bacterium]|nr:helix-turn-helix transcriptional regulator [Clostridia bacterium]